MWIVPPLPGVIEPSVTPEFYCDGDTAVELIGDCARFWLTAIQMPLEATGGLDPHAVVVCKIVKPLRAVPKVIGSLAQCLDFTAPFGGVRDGPRGPRLVKG